MLVLLLWFAYDFHFKYIINDYQARQIEKRLQQNFHNNRDSFQDLIAFSQNFSRLEGVEFRNNGQIRFQVYDTLLDREALDNNFISIGDNPTFEISNLEFVDSNAVEVTSGDQTFQLNNWILDFEGDISHVMVNKLLSYNNANTDLLEQLKQKLDNVNCFAYDHNDSLLTIRYVGHWGEGFNYLFPFTHNAEKTHWNELIDNFYWEHYQHDLFCGWTDW